MHTIITHIHTYLHKSHFWFSESTDTSSMTCVQIPSAAGALWGLQSSCLQKPTRSSYSDVWETMWKPGSEKLSHRYSTLRSLLCLAQHPNELSVYLSPGAIIERQFLSNAHHMLKCTWSSCIVNYTLSCDFLARKLVKQRSLEANSLWPLVVSLTDIRKQNTIIKAKICEGKNWASTAWMIYASTCFFDDLKSEFSTNLMSLQYVPTILLSFIIIQYKESRLASGEVQLGWFRSPPRAICVLKHGDIIGSLTSFVYQ